jgi:predicted dehydrogenase
MLKQPLRVAVIGGGAIAEMAHLPALVQASHAVVAGLAEVDPGRRTLLADRFHICRAVADYRELIGVIDAAIIALPHHLHAAVAVELLLSGVHVLVEKPMALNIRDSDAMISASRSSGAILAVGLARRFVPSLQFTRTALQSGMLGDLRHFQLSEGRIYDWNPASAYAFERQSGGVLADLGAHALDLVLWWFGDCAQFMYFDDALGGVESDCHIELTMTSGLSGTVDLSRSRTLRDICTIEGSRATLAVGIKPRSHVQLTIQGIDSLLTGEVRSEASHASADRFRLQLEDFLGAVRDGRPVAVPGTEGRRSVDLIERCYQQRRRLDRPWDRIEGCPAQESQ